MDPDATNDRKESSPIGESCGDACLVTIHGVKLGQRVSLDRPLLSIGRDPGNDLVLDLEDVSRRHARVTLEAGRAFLEDLGSTNGTRLNGRLLAKGERFELRQGDMLQVCGAILKFLEGGNVEAQYHEEIYRMTIEDGLTGASNRRYLVEILAREMSRCRRHRRALSLILFDVDHFRAINDNLGHVAGDSVLRELVTVVQPHIRREECLARYGGDEFAVVMPDTGLSKARLFAEKIRGLADTRRFDFEGEAIHITLSLGVAEMAATMVEPSQFIREADANLYAAKDAGRNAIGARSDAPTPRKASRRGPRSIARRKQ